MKQTKGPGGNIQYNKKTTYSLYDPPGKAKVTASPSKSKSYPNIFLRFYHAFNWGSFVFGTLKTRSFSIPMMIPHMEEPRLKVVDVEFSLGKRRGLLMTKSAIYKA